MQVLVFGSVDVGVMLIAAASLLWPAVAWLYVALPQQIGLPVWKVFARAAGAALTVTALLAGWATWLLATNGTSQSMAAIGPQVAALSCVGGAVICAVTAFVLRLRHHRRSVSDDPPPSGSQ